MTLVIKGLITHRFDFTKDVGKGSRAEVNGFIFLIMFLPLVVRCLRNGIEVWKCLAVGRQSGQTERGSWRGRSESYLLVS